MELKDKLGPINWQFMATKKFDPDDFEAFLKLLPKTVDGRSVRHAVEVRHESFAVPDFVALARKYQVAIVCRRRFRVSADRRRHRAIRLCRASWARATPSRTAIPSKLSTCGPNAPGDGHPAEAPADLETSHPSRQSKTGRDVFLYVISGFKERNPAAAMALIERQDKAAS